VRCDDSARVFLQRAGLDWDIGDSIERDGLDRLADIMADALFAALDTPAAEAALWLTQPLAALPADGLLFSGGVAEFIYQRETRDFSDMGRRLGRAIRARLDAQHLPVPLLPAGECIRATALGASEFSVQMSGQTSFISPPATLLPRRNLPVLMPAVSLSGVPDASAIASAIAAHRRAFDFESATRDFALAFRWRGDHDYARVRALADGIALGLADRIGAGAPLYIMLEGDAALTLGGILREVAITGVANPTGTVVLIALYILFYEVSVGPLLWVLSSEMFPTQIRGTAMSSGSTVAPPHRRSPGGASR
jgi:ethanolamine utilization protein EutA